MTILTVSNSLNVLSDLNGLLTKIYPDAEIIREIDPLMAGKYSFRNAVDMVFADVNMKRMTGLQLIQFIKREHAHVLAYLVGTVEEIDDSLAMTTSDDITGTIVYPFTEDTFLRI